MTKEDLTLGFEATTQEGVHLNTIHITTKSDWYVLTIDKLPGGTAEDYENHVYETVDRLAEMYAAFQELDYQLCKRQMITNISNTMTDRAAVNHSAILYIYIYQV